jgi:hypothetical protein
MGQVVEQSEGEWDVPVYGTWTSRPLGEFQGNEDFVSDTPGPIATNPNLAYKFTFNGVLEVSDDDVRAFAEAVRGMKQLRGLKLQGCPITDKAAKFIASCTNLESLALPGGEGMTDRTIEIDQQTADGRGHERRPEGTGERPRHDQRTGIVPAVRVQQRSMPPKQPSIGRGYPVAAVFTGDEEGVDRRGRSPEQFGQLAKHLTRALAPFTG